MFHAHRRSRSTRRHALIRLSLLAPLLAACTNIPATAPPAAPATSSLAAQAVPAETTQPGDPPLVTATAEPTATLLATPPVTRTVALGAIRPLQNTAIVERPARLRAVTDGTTRYRVAEWAPGSAWIAAVPQDGPGMDLINSVTGEVQPVVTDTYVLEPVWNRTRRPNSAGTATNADELLVQRIVDGRDQIDRFSVQQRRSTPIVVSDQPLRAISISGGGFWCSRPAALVRCDSNNLSEVLVPEAALVTAPNNADVLAWTPVVTTLETVQTWVSRTTGGAAPVAISASGEGLWLPRWSADDRKLALSSIEGRIVTTSLDGVLDQERPNERYDLGPGATPAWAPDSARIAFAGQSAGREFTTRDIFVVDWQGKGPRLRLTDAGDEQFFQSPSWSPDGAQLAFVEIDSGQIFVADAPPGQ